MTLIEELDQITRHNELESGYSLGVKGNFKNNLGFWRSIGAPDDLAVLELVNSGPVRMVNEQPLVANPLSVSIQTCGN